MEKNKETEVKDFTTVYTIKGEEVKVTMPARFNIRSGELVYDGDLDDAAANKAADIYRERHGLVSPIDILTFREKTGISIAKLAELASIDPFEMQLIELGEVPSEEQSRVLKSLIKVSDDVKSHEDKVNELKKLALHTRHPLNRLVSSRRLRFKDALIKNNGKSSDEYILTNGGVKATVGHNKKISVLKV